MLGVLFLNLLTSVASADLASVEQTNCHFDSTIVEVTTKKALDHKQSDMDTAGQQIRWDLGHAGYFVNLLKTKQNGAERSVITMNKLVVSPQDQTTGESREEIETLTLSQNGEGAQKHVSRRDDLFKIENDEIKIINLTNKQPDTSTTTSIDGDTRVTVETSLQPGPVLSGYQETSLIKTCRISAITEDQADTSGFFVRVRQGLAKFESLHLTAVLADHDFQNCLMTPNADCLNQQKLAATTALAMDVEWTALGNNSDRLLPVVHHPNPGPGGSVFHRGGGSGGGCQRDMMGICYPTGSTAEQRAVDSIRYEKERQREQAIDDLIRKGGHIP